MMPINGLLLTLTEDENLVSGIVSEISQREDVELGERTERWLPVVVDTAGTRESHEVHEWLVDLPGVLTVDVVFTSVSDPKEANVK